MVGQWSRVSTLLTSPQSPEDGRGTQEELLGILTWFANWCEMHDLELQQGKKTNQNCLPSGIWRDLHSLMIGHVVIIQYYCIENGQTVVPKNTNMDPCENHFANARQLCGRSTNSLDVAKARAADSKLYQFNAARRQSRVKGANNADAPDWMPAAKGF
eukprot:scaffold274581_cov57-Attheya_sp.AAC.3